MEEFILEGKPFKFSYEGVDYHCEVFYQEYFNTHDYYKIIISKKEVANILFWKYEYLSQIYVLEKVSGDGSLFTLIGNKKFFSPTLIKEELISSFKRMEANRSELEKEKERIKNIKIVKEL